MLAGSPQRLGMPSGEMVLGQARGIVLQVYLCVQRMTITSSYIDCSLKYNISIINQVEITPHIFTEYLLYSRLCGRLET